MPNHLSKQIDSQADVIDQVNALHWHAKVEAFYGEFETGASNDGAVSNGDTIDLVIIPAGYRIVDMWVAMDDNAGSTTMSVGPNDGDVDGYIASTSVASGPTLQRMDAPAQPLADSSNGLTSDTRITLTAGGANYADDVTIKIVVLAVRTA